jgi:hypothetical protein
MAFTGLLALVSIAGIAYAAKPFDPSNKKIVIHSSIAGVKLGQSIGAAKGAWRGAAKCGSQGDAVGCNWGSERKGYLSFGYARGTDRVDQVTIFAGISEHKNVYRKPLTTLKTSKGIGLGSKKSAVKRAYPGGRKDGSFPNSYCLHRGNTVTRFFFDERNRAFEIILYRGYGDQLAVCSPGS